MAKANLTIPQLTPQDIQRFNDKIKYGLPDECWNWTAGKSEKGYGKFRIGNHTYRAPRIAYFLAFDSDPDDLLVCHHCDNSACCNSAHFFLGTDDDNMQDCKNKNRRPRLHGEANPARKQSQYMRRGENHYFHINKHLMPRGETHNSAKLTEDIVRAIRQEHKDNPVPLKILATKYKVSTTAISRIIKRQLWTHI